MYLKIKGHPLPGGANNFAFAPGEAPTPGLVPLGRALWPAKVVAQVSAHLLNAGIPSPQQVKLVEPYALAFGGRDKDGVPDHSQVDWQQVVDYFEWEAAAMVRQDEEEAGRLQDQAGEKYQIQFSHYGVYEGPFNYSAEW